MMNKNAEGSIADQMQLLGAPDHSIGSNVDTKTGQSMRVQLVQELTEEMRNHVRHGKAQVVFGKNPVRQTMSPASQ